MLTKLKYRYAIIKFLLVWLNQLTRLHPPLDDLRTFNFLFKMFSKTTKISLFEYFSALVFSNKKVIEELYYLKRSIKNTYFFNVHSFNLVLNLKAGMKLLGMSQIFHYIIIIVFIVFVLVFIINIISWSKNDIHDKFS